MDVQVRLGLEFMERFVAFFSPVNEQPHSDDRPEKQSTEFSKRFLPLEQRVPSTSNEDGLDR